MGISHSTSMEENFKKNQDFIQSISKIKMERHIQMMYQLRERSLAMEIAKQREMCNWITAFTVVATIGLFTGFRRTKRPYLLAPMLPLTFFTAYQIDCAYGTKIYRIQQEAENIMQFEPEILELPCGLPTASSIDQARLDVEEKIKLHPSNSHI
ncbi:plasminogen receptor (KT) [Arctopsyche grandis]|uniref:plasminogen receptor (KT) n=1 Tax=Arctopsyche grandis TaxID=121162 RepID=UPI00406D7E78